MPNRPAPKLINNFINGKTIIPTNNKYLPVYSPINATQIASVGLSSSTDVFNAVEAAQIAFKSWSSLTIKSRASIMMKFHNLVKEHSNELAELIVQENGKNITEALADVAKGNETVEYACSLPQLAKGSTLQVSTEVKCEDRRDPLGVVASIVPFNFPFMVPMWTLPIALVMGNTIVLKPSEKVPITMYKTVELLKKAGVPDGVVNLVQGGREAVESIIDHPKVRAVTFVGSSPVAKVISDRCNNLNKRCTALGGAKNHLIALPDCSIEDTARDIVVSSFGCAGQRCMAASVLLVIGSGPARERLMSKIIEKAMGIEFGIGPGQMGPVIDQTSLAKITRYIDDAEKSGAEILLDGRSWMGQREGNWIGPTIIKHKSSDDAAMKEEVFGPCLSVFDVASWTEAVNIENSSEFGNAASVYTSNGGSADWFTHRFRSSMLGVNVGIPVPREPFSFGGLYGTRSKFGDMDITGDGAIEFFSNRIKVTTKWILPKFIEHPHSDVDDLPTDHANFAGTM